MTERSPRDNGPDELVSMSPSPVNEPSMRGHRPCHIDTPNYTFTLPDLTALPDDFRQFLEKDIIETSTLRLLENSGHLNWWHKASTAAPQSTTADNGESKSVQLVRFLPLSTSGDGNCLLHAASLGMWGFHDRLLVLRQALHSLLTSGRRRHALWRRWRWQQTQFNKQTGLIYSEEEWLREWQAIVNMAAPLPRSKAHALDNEHESPDAAPAADGQDDAQVESCDERPASTSSVLPATYESLEEIHVFALAHVLKRPIVVIADTVLRGAHGDPLAPITFGGVYLPLECTPREVHRSPLVLCYDAAHFSALVAMQQKAGAVTTKAVVPITDRQRRLLPVHFACDPGADFTWWSDAADERLAARAILDDPQRLALVCKYMDVAIVPVASRLAAVNGAIAGPRNSRSLPHFISPPSLASFVEPLQRAPAPIQQLATSLKKRLFTRTRNSSITRAGSDYCNTKHVGRTASLARAERRRNSCTGRAVDTLTYGRRSASHTPASGIRVEHLRDSGVVVGALLHNDITQPYMQDMLGNYLRHARERFDRQRAADAVRLHAARANTGASKNVTQPAACDNGATTQPVTNGVGGDGLLRESGRPSPDARRRRGISRNLSASNSAALMAAAGVDDHSYPAALPDIDGDIDPVGCNLGQLPFAVTCMNDSCDRLASHATNFLCAQCFRTQKEIMAGLTAARHRRTASAAAAPCASAPRELPAVSVQPSVSDTGPVQPREDAASKIDQHADRSNATGAAQPVQLAKTVTKVAESDVGTSAETRLPVGDKATWQKHCITVKKSASDLGGDMSEVAYDVAAVTAPSGVTRYYCYEATNGTNGNHYGETLYCRSPLCSNYSNGHGALCVRCTTTRH